MRRWSFTWSSSRGLRLARSRNRGPKRCSIAGATHRLEAAGRLGRSFVGIGNGAFTARRMIWAAFRDGASPQAIEARTITENEGAARASARVLDRGRWTDANLERLKLTPATPR